MTVNLNREESPRDIKKRETLTQEYSTREIVLTEEQQKFWDENLSSKLWRLSNTYTILDKDGKKTVMSLNKSQRKVLKDYQHPKKIILKSRQQGISTLFLAYFLDDCLYKPGYQAGIQSYGQDEAEKLAKRALMMWNELDQNIKDLLDIKLVSNNNKGMTFSNGSILKIGNFRGDTLQGLHVSELGKIASKYPEKAKELKTGAFQAVGKNNKISVESTSEGATGMFYDMCQKAIRTQKRIDAGKQDRLSPFDFQFIFLSWVEDPDCNIDIPQPISKEMENYFESIEEELGHELTASQKWWYVSKEDELKDYMKQEYPTTPEEAFRNSVEGTYYSKEYEQLEIKSGLYNHNSSVFSVMDIGVNDTNSILFCQKNGEYIDIINEYGNSGVGVEYYKDIYDELHKAYGYIYDMTLFPHDIKVQEWGNGITRLKVVRKLGFNPRIVKKHTRADGIEITRKFLRGKVRIDPRCTNLITAIQMYRRRFDKRLSVFLEKPEHDEYSHWADALRYLACGLLQHSPNPEISPFLRNESNEIREVKGFAI